MVALYVKASLLVSIVTLLTAPSANGMVREEFSCNPVEDCKSVGVGGKVPDPDLCDQYYLCISDGSNPDSAFPSDNPVVCPEGQYFNFEKANCTDEGETECKDLCLNICKLSCEESGDMVANPGEDNTYYYCTDGQPLLITCPSGEIFNGTGCDPDESHKCDTCSPYCEMANTETMDPYDCKSYYLCSGQGVPDDADHYTCEDSLYFEPQEGRCVTGAETCESLCTSTPSTVSNKEVTQPVKL